MRAITMGCLPPASSTEKLVLTRTLTPAICFRSYASRQDPSVLRPITLSRLRDTFLKNFTHRASPSSTGLAGQERMLLVRSYQVSGHMKDQIHPLSPEEREVPKDFITTTPDEIDAPSFFKVAPSFTQLRMYKILSLPAIILLGVMILASHLAPHCQIDLPVEVSSQIDLPMEARFEQWMTQHGRVYKDAAKKARRFNIFKANAEYIDSANAADDRKYTLSANLFSDLTEDEFMASYTGLGYIKRSYTSNAVAGMAFNNEFTSGDRYHEFEVNQGECST